MSEAGSREGGKGADYLIDETVVVFQPTLACAIGENGAIILQQVHWLTRNSFDRRYRVRQKDGRFWVQIKPQDILDPVHGHLRFMSLRTFRRVTGELQESGALLVMQWPRYGLANFYAVDRTRLAEIVQEFLEKQEWHSNVCQNGTVNSATKNGDKIGTESSAKVAHKLVPELHESSAKMAQSHPLSNKREGNKEKAGASTDDDEATAIDADIAELPADIRFEIEQDAIVRLGPFYDAKKHQGGFNAMKRNIYREYLADGRISD